MVHKANKIPALTLSGGTLVNLKDVKEFRIWVHPRYGDASYYRFDTLKEANTFLPIAKKSKEQLSEVESPIAVIWDKAQKNYREVEIPKKLLK